MTASIVKAVVILASVGATLSDPSQVPGDNWVSLSKGIEFQASESSSPDHAPALRRAQQRLLGYSENFVDGAETVYDGYSQAWRLLGVYIDCNAAAAEARRTLQEGDDQNTGDVEQQSPTCARYLLWGAYVDMEYEGQGSGEYQYYDHATKKWNNSACKASGSSRCAKMDCHLPSTQFDLLGFFKQYDSLDWLDQLFQHQGSCQWDDETYAFMTTARDMFPENCEQASSADEDGSVLYYDMKPLSGGGVGIALYTDDSCSIEYTGQVSVEDVFGAANADYGPGLNDFLSQWNTKLEAYTTCQPCITINLSNDSGEGGDENADAQNGNFICVDAAGGQGVNQCSVFKENTEMKRATFNDLALATRQGTIARANAAGVGPSRFKQWWSAWGFIFTSFIMFLLGIMMFIYVSGVPKRVGVSKEPLMEKVSRRSRKTNSAK